MCLIKLICGQHKSWPAAILTAVGLLALTVSHNGAASSTEQEYAADALHREIESFLHDWNIALATQEPERIRSAYTSDGRLRWFEDGRLRYQSLDDILQALQQFPPGTQIETQLSGITIELLSDRIASGSAFFHSRLLMPGQNVEFEGVFTMLLERTEQGWVFVTGHSSTHRQESTAER